MTSPRASDGFIPVTIDVPKEHPHLFLMDSLDWFDLEQTLASHWRAAGKNVDHSRGRPFDLSYWTRVIVLMLLLKLHPRQMEQHLKYNVVARVFVSVPHPTETFVRDHANIDRAYRALGVDGIKELNCKLLRIAQQLGFTSDEELSADATAQEIHMAYPNEPGILRNVAQRVVRLTKRVLKAGGSELQEVSEKIIERAKEVFKLVKEHRLFAKNQQERQSVLEQILEQAEKMMSWVTTLQEQGSQHASAVVQRGCVKLLELQEFLSTLKPQIESWLKTGKVATEKLLHPGFPEARSHVRNKAGKKVEFGFKWLVSRLAGGYLCGQMFVGRPAESKMPMEARTQYREIFGEGATPKLFGTRPV